MKIDAEITQRFEELINKGKAVLATRVRQGGGFPDYVENQLVGAWSVSALSFIGRVVGTDSEHYKRFSDLIPQIGRFTNTERAFGYLVAASEDYKGGYLFDTERAITADVFDEFLEQAEYFLGEGYFQITAVVAGAVLEDALRRICAQNGFSLPAKAKLDTMNADLAKAGVYDKLVQKRVTMLADLRNKAAHGKWNEFEKSDSEEMVKAVRTFIENNL